MGLSLKRFDGVRLCAQDQSVYCSFCKHWSCIHLFAANGVDDGGLNPGRPLAQLLLSHAGVATPSGSGLGAKLHCSKLPRSYMCHPVRGRQKAPNHALERISRCSQASSSTVKNPCMSWSVHPALGASPTSRTQACLERPRLNAGSLIFEGEKRCQTWGIPE